MDDTFSRIDKIQVYRGEEKLKPSYLTLFLKRLGRMIDINSMAGLVAARVPTRIKKENIFPEDLNCHGLLFSKTVFKMWWKEGN